MIKRTKNIHPKTCDLWRRKYNAGLYDTTPEWDARIQSFN
jgi:hypothetical protein